MMLKLYNSLSQAKELFVPLETGKVKLYVCGVTVYSDCHIGHARTFLNFDTLLRYLNYLKFQVTYIRNITDIDDKIIRRAEESAITWQELSDKFSQSMQADFKALNLLPANHEPKASEHIASMIKVISQLIEQDTAYFASNGDVYFSIDKFKTYGNLAKRQSKDQQAGARIEINLAKRNPHDFTLWKLAKPGEPAWDSPWGGGRPGWHIECSCMVLDHFGPSIDIHGGGIDLKFPHHENELAQAEALSAKPYAKYWLHSGHLTVKNEKMSKSLNNFLTIKDILRDTPAETLRYFCLSAHYRSPLEYSSAAIVEAGQALKRLKSGLIDCQAVSKALNHPLEKRFQEAMNDDLNTPRALAILFELLDLIKANQAQNKIDLSLVALLAGLLQVLGLNHLADTKQTFSNEELMEIEKIIANRQVARLNKDWDLADKLRQKLLKMNIFIKDEGDKTTWQAKN